MNWLMINFANDCILFLFMPYTVPAFGDLGYKNKDTKATNCKFLEKDRGWCDADTLGWRLT